MPCYAAFLGHQSHISLAELITLLPDIKIQKLWDNRIVTFETSIEITTNWLRGIGGTALIAKQIPLAERYKGKDDIDLGACIPKMLFEEIKRSSKEEKDVRGKATFSFRCLGVQRSHIRSLYRTCKQALRERKCPSRYIGNERHPAKPGTLLLRGIPGPRSCEIVILKESKSSGGKKGGSEHMWVGATCAVQDIEAYTSRDIHKPFRDTKTGLMPPKLAQIMLNLVTTMLPQEIRSRLAKEPHQWEGLTLWDPFCGSGVIVLEALLRRAHVLGSDNMERAVQGCKENVRWMRLKEKTPKAITSTIFKHNATKSYDLSKNPTVIITETSLGPPLKGPPTKQEIGKLIRQAEILERGFFENIASIAPETPVVCAFPVFVARDGTKHYLTKVLNIIQKLGYRQSSTRIPFFKESDRHSLLYLRPDQFVGREIFCFLPTRGTTPKVSQKKLEVKKSAHINKVVIKKSAPINKVVIKRPATKKKTVVEKKVVRKKKKK